MHPGTFGGGDLVAHQGEQRRDDEGRACAAAEAFPDQSGGDEVHRRLSPAGALDDEDAFPVADQCFDGVELAVAEVGVRPSGEFAEDLRGAGAEVGGGGGGSSGGVGRAHAPHPRGGTGQLRDGQG